MDFSIAHQCGGEAHIHGRGAELEGENVPLIVDGQTVAEAECKDDLFVDFQSDDYQRGDQQPLPEGSVTQTGISDGTPGCNEERSEKESYMEKTIKLRNVHLKMENIKDYVQ